MHGVVTPKGIGWEPAFAGEALHDFDGHVGGEGQGGLGLEASKTAVKAYLTGGKWNLVGEFVEVGSFETNTP